MKIFIITIFISILNTSESINEKIGDKKWNFEWLEIKNTRKNMNPLQKKRNWFYFNKNGDFERMDNSVKTTGKWLYNKRKNIIKIYDTYGINNYNIISIKKNIMILSKKEKDTNLYICLKTIKK